jgi:hypothetical protein
VLRFAPYYPDRVVRYFALTESEMPVTPDHGGEGRSGAATSAAQPTEPRLADPGEGISN